MTKHKYINNILYTHFKQNGSSFVFLLIFLAKLM